MSTFKETFDSFDEAIDSDYCLNNNNNIKQEDFDTKIQIVEEGLVKTELLDTKVRKKELFGQVISSLDVLCDICSDNKVQRVIKLNKPERVVGTILLKKLFKLGLKSHQIFHRKIPEQSCGRCFAHLILLKQTLRNKFLEHKSKKMYPASGTHGIECPCAACKNQYGDLDLIIRGIETRSSPLLPSTIASINNEEQDSFKSEYVSPQQQQHQEGFLYPYNYESYPQSTSDSYSTQPLPTMLQEFEPQPSTSNYQEQSTDTESPRKKTKKSCPHCDKQFNHTGDFRKHLRKHTKERPYACAQCDKRFSHTSNLHRHERSHSGDRPFKCDFCNKEFNRKDKLDSHRNSKTCKSKRSNK